MKSIYYKPNELEKRLLNLFGKISRILIIIILLAY